MLYSRWPWPPAMRGRDNGTSDRISPAREMRARPCSTNSGATSGSSGGSTRYGTQKWPSASRSIEWWKRGVSSTHSTLEQPSSMTR